MTDTNPPSNDRRRDTRFQVPDSVAIIDPDSLGEVTSDDSSFSLLIPEVANESAGGICLAFDEPVPMSEGDDLTLTHDGESRLAVVCRISVSPKGQYLVGCRWLDAP